MRRWSFTVILAAAALMAPLSAQKQGQLFLSLTSPDGKPIEGLKAEDFQIFEDGKLQKVETFELIRSELARSTGARGVVSQTFFHRQDPVCGVDGGHETRLNTETRSDGGTESFM